MIAACTNQHAGPVTSVNLNVTSVGPPPVLIAYRNAGDGWQVPRQTTDKNGSAVPGSYTLSIGHAYEYLVVCAQGSAFDAELTGATEEDGTIQYASCVADVPQPTTVAVTGTLAEPGTAAMGGEQMSTMTNDATFSLGVTPGANDLIAFDASSVLIERGQQVSGPMSVGTLDLGVNGIALDQVGLSVTGTDSGYGGVSLFWVTGNNTVANWSGSGNELGLPPASVVISDDVVNISATDTSADGLTERSASYNYDYSGSLLPLALPGPIVNVTLDTTTTALTGTWEAPPAQDMIMALSVQASAEDQSTGFTATPSWLAANQGNQLMFDVSPAPSGYQSSWQISPRGAIYAELDAITPSSAAVEQYTVYSTGLNGAAARTLSSRRSQLAGRARVPSAGSPARR